MTPAARVTRARFLLCPPTRCRTGSDASRAIMARGCVRMGGKPLVREASRVRVRACVRQAIRTSVAGVDGAVRMVRTGGVGDGMAGRSWGEPNGDAAVLAAAAKDVVAAADNAAPS